MVIILTNLVAFEHPMMHTKFQDRKHFGFREEEFLKFFIIYRHGDHLGHVTRTIWANFRSPNPWKIHVKFDFDWPSDF